MGTQQLEGIVMPLHKSECAKTSACWQNTLFSSADPLQKWLGTKGGDADGWREDACFKGASNDVWSGCCTAEN